MIARLKGLLDEVGGVVAADERDAAVVGEDGSERAE